MRIVVAGASNLGVALVEKLIAAEHDVVLVDRDRAKLDAIAESVDCGMIAGDCTLPSILREAIGDAKAAVYALTGSDQANILCASVAKSLGASKAVPRIRNVELMPICEQLGVDEPIAPDERIAAGLVDLVADGSAGDMEATLTGEVRLAQFDAKEAIAGAALADLDLGAPTAPVAVVRADRSILPQDAGPIETGDIVIFAVERSKVSNVRAAYEKLIEETGS